MRLPIIWARRWGSALLCLSVVLPMAHAEDESAAKGSIEVLTTATGKPIQAEVEIRRLPEDVQVPMAKGAPFRSAKTNAAGRTTFRDLPPGPYEIRATTGKARPTRGYAKVPDSGGVVAVRVPCGSGRHRVQGRAIWRDGAPFRGWLVLQRDEYYFGTYTSCMGAMAAEADDDGAFEFPGLLQGTYELGCQTVGRTFVAQDEPILRVPMEGSFVYVVDAGGGRLQGTVTSTADGSPVPGAKLSVRSLGIWHPGKALADSSGNYGIAVPDAIYPELLVQAEGFAPRRLPVPRGDHQIDIRLDKPGVVEGTVFADGTKTPVKGAVVHAVWDAIGDDEAIHRTSITEPDGKYRIEGLVPGPNTLFVLGGGWATSGSSPWDDTKSKDLVVDVVAGEIAQRTLRAVRAGEARIEVRTADGKPARVAALAIEPSTSEVYKGSTWDLPWSDTYSGKTVDAEGNIHFDNLIPGVPYRGGLDALGDRFTVLIPATKSGQTSVVRKKLPPRELLSGGPRYTRGPNRPGSPGISGRVRGPAALDRHLVELKVQGLHSDGTSDGNASHVTVHAPCGGPFAIENLDRKRYLLTARARWRGVEYGAKQTVAAGASSLNLVLQPLARQDQAVNRIQILDADGQPVPRAQGWFTGLEDDIHFGNNKVHAGALEYDAAPGVRHVWIEITTPTDGMGRPINAGAHILGPLAVKDIPEEIRLPASGSIAGRVLAPDGQGVSGAQVMALPLRPLQERRAGRFVGAVHAWARTSEDGTYEFRGLGRGPYQVSVDPPAGFAWPDMVGPIAPGADDLVLRLSRATTARLRLVDAVSRPLPGSKVQIRWRDTDGRSCAFMHFEGFAFPWAGSSWGLHKTWKADDKGEVEIPNLHPRRDYTVVIRPPDGRSNLRPVTLKNWIPHSGEVALGRAHEIAGVVRDQEGRPLPGFMVGRLSALGHWQLVRSDDEGRFRFQNLVGGRHRISAVGNLLGPPGSTVTTEVQADRMDVVLTVDARRMLRLDFPPFGPGMRLVQPLNIFLWPKGRSHLHRQAFVMTPGAYYLSGLDPDTEYIACSVPEGGQPVLHEAAVRAGGDPLKIQLSKGMSIRGQVLLPDGMEGERLALIASFGPVSVNVRVSKEAAFEVPGLPAGTKWTLVARAGFGRASLEGQITARAGDGGVVLRLARAKQE